MPNIDLKTASLILERSWVEAEECTDRIATLITKVLTGTHKTYRYVLVTGLLAKATNESVNALSLQKSDGTDGKYDARTLCHHVVVPFETLKLQGCLGNSNEPFLNKPARFVMLSLNNAVRRGKDHRTLSDLIEILSSVHDSKTAYHYLKHALWVLMSNHAAYIAKYSVGDALIDMSEFAQLVLDYIYRITDRSFEGEICPLVVAQLEQMYLGNSYRVEAHKVNQSGSSSKEVGDIDIYDGDNNLVNAIEVKDKDFSEQDVVHAIDKFRIAHLNSSMFIYGKNVTFDKETIYRILKSIGREGHYCCLISVLDYAKLRISNLKTITIRQFVDGLLVFARAINAKDETITEIKEIAKHIF